MGILQEEIDGDIGSAPQCGRCGSERVARDAWACWNRESGLWELEHVFDEAHCHACEEATTLSWVRSAELVAKRVRELNDQLRQSGKGRGSIMLTSGLQGLGSEFVVAAVGAVRTFDGFSDENDPWGEHDFGSVDVDGEKVFFKIDYYDLSLQNGSENPANEGCTHRVLTIMLASEY
ncbi:DUF3768 domain-containing protein [Roseobacteraceae bacterium S113]